MRRLAHLSDLHFGTETSPVLSELGASLERFQPELLVITGDLTQRARESQFRLARSFLDALPFPRVVVPGNHDIAPLYRPVTRLLMPYARYRRYITAEIDSTWHDDELLVLALSSVQPWRWKEGTISRRQLAWIAASAKRLPSAVRLLAAHHPLVHASTERPTRRLRRHSELFRVLDAADVSVCLSGHLHQSFSGLAIETADEPGSVLAIHASTATSTRLRGHANAYNQITIDGAALQVDAVAYDGQKFALLSRARYQRHARVWQPMGMQPDLPAPAHSDAGGAAPGTG